MASPYEQLVNSGTPASAPGPTPPVSQIPAPPPALANPPPSDTNANGLPNNDLYNNVLPAINKFSNSALFGLPEAIYKRLGLNMNNFSTTPKDPTVNTISGLAGTAASIPLGGIAAKGLGVGGSVLKNALMGSAMSGAAPIIEGDPDALKKAGTGALLGAGGAVAGNLLGKLIPKILPEAEKMANQAVISTQGIPGKQLINDYMGNAIGSPAYKIQFLDNYQNKLADFISGKNAGGVNLIPKLGRTEKIAELYDAIKTPLKEADSVLAENADAFNSSLTDKAIGVMDNMKQKYIGSVTPEGKPIDTDSIVDSLNTKLENIPDFAGKREFLQNVMDNNHPSTPSGANVSQKAVFDAAAGLTHGVMGAAQDTLDSLGKGDLLEPLQQWHFLQLAAKSNIKSELKNMATTMGPNTAEKLGMNAAFGGDLGTTAANSVKGYLLNKAIPAAATYGAAAARPAISALAKGTEGITNKLGAIAPGTFANLTNAISSANIRGGGQPDTSTSGSSNVNPNFPIDPNSPEFAQKIDEGIRQHWIMGGNGYADPNFTSPQFKRFEAAIKQHIAEAGPDQMRVAAPVLFPTSPENKKAYLDYLSSNESVASAFPGAQFGNQLENQWAKLPLVGNPGGVAKREQFQSALAKAVGGDKAAAAYMTQLDRANPKDRAKIIANAVGRNNPLAARLLASLGGTNG